jgi:hypothetical protein
MEDEMAQDAPHSQGSGIAALAIVNSLMDLLISKSILSADEAASVIDGAIVDLRNRDDGADRNAALIILNRIPHHLAKD